jgi:DNA-binding transcriptional LysR family regulator
MAQLENFRLKVFRTVAQHLSFRKAAEHLFLTQPAVTLQIKALEDDLGARLFERGPKGVSLTPQGSLLLGYAQKMASLVAEAEQKIASEDGKISGEFAVGVSTTIAQYVLPRLIGAFLAEHPRVKLSLHSGNTEEIVQLLLDEKVSVGLIEGPARHREVRTEPFMEDELVLIVPVDFEFDRLTRERILAETQVFQECDGPRLHRGYQIHSRGRTGHWFRFTLGHLERTGIEVAEGCRSHWSSCHPPFFPHFAGGP